MKTEIIEIKQKQSRNKVTEAIVEKGTIKNEKCVLKTFIKLSREISVLESNGLLYSVKYFAMQSMLNMNITDCFETRQRLFSGLI